MSNVKAAALATVSVVIPTRNRARLLERAIRSVLNQTYRHLEVLVIDDGSTDGGETDRVARSFGDARLRYLSHSSSRGGAAARNTGIRAATGCYIAFLDDDDEWDATKTERQLRVLERYDAVLCTSDEDVLNKRWGHVCAITPDDFRAGKYTAGGTGVLMAQTFVLKQLLFDETLKRCQDWDLFIRLVNRYMVGYLHEPLVRYNEGTHDRISNAIINLPPSEVEKQLRILEKHRNFFGRRWYRRHMCRFLLYGIKHRPDRWQLLLYAAKRCGAGSVIWAISRRMQQKLRLPMRTLLFSHEGR